MHTLLRSRAFHQAVVFAVSLLVFWQCHAFPFVFDDDLHVNKNPTVRDCNLSSILGNGYWENVTEGTRTFAAGGDLYRPLTTLSISLAYQAFGDNPRWYHVENMALHALVSMLLYGLCLAWGLTQTASLFVALCFAVAPIHVEPVASVVLRNELLAGLFSIVCLRCHARARPVDRNFLVPVTCLAALAAKENAIMLPFLALLADWLVLRRSGMEWRLTLRPYMGMLGAIVIYLAARHHAIGQLSIATSATYFEDTGLLTRILTMSRFSVEEYLSAALLGTPLVFDYSRSSFPDASPSDPVAWALLVALLLGTGILVYHALRIRSAWTLGPLFFLVAIAPVSNFLIPIGAIGALRFLYLPYAGIALALVAFGSAISSSRFRPPRWLLVTMSVAILTGYSCQTMHRLRPWHTSYELYSDVIRNAPNNGPMQIEVGQLALQFALERLKPPGDAEALSTREWMTLALDHYIAGLRGYPKHYGTIPQNFIFAAVSLDREPDLVELFDSGIRSIFLGINVPKPPTQSELSKVPMSQECFDQLLAWSNALEFMEKQGPKPALVKHVCTLLPFYLRVRSHVLARTSGVPVDAFRARASFTALQSVMARFRQEEQHFVQIVKMLAAKVEQWSRVQ